MSGDPEDAPEDFWYAFHEILPNNDRTASIMRKRKEEEEK